MKIRSKLMLLVLGSFGLLGLTVGIYFLTLLPVNRMEAERSWLGAISEQALIMQISLNRLMIDPMDQALNSWDESYAAYQKSISNLSNITLLPSINETVQGAIKALGNLKDLTTEGVQKLASSFNLLKEDLTNANLAPSNITMPDLLTDKPFIRAAPDPILRFHLANFIDSLDNLNMVVDASRNSITKQSTIIAAEINKVRDRSLVSASAGLLVLLGLLLVFSVYITRPIVRSIASLESTIHRLGSLDLTVRFSLKAKDEIGRLSQELNGFVEILNRSFTEIQKASQENLTVSNKLGASVADATSSAIEIEANSASIGERMAQMNGMAQESAQKISAVSSSIGAFNGRLATQDQHVETAASAVTQMLASIGSIARIAGLDKQAAGELVQESERGKVVFESAFDQIATIAANVGNIQEMAEVIAGIAAQTNILAMNAAIEAAHAGEFGKGFAVVADEIGKLASASAVSSEDIGRSIKEIVSRITDADSTRVATSQSFENIISRIHVVSDSVAEIHGNVNEMQTGSQQILESMEFLKSSSSQLTQDSRQIVLATMTIESTISKLGQISAEVASNISEITTGLHDISSTVHLVNEQAQLIGDTGANLDAAGKQFTTSQNTD